MMGQKSWPPLTKNVLTVQKGVLVLLSSQFSDHSEQYGALKLLWDSGYDMSLGNLAYNIAGEAD